MADNKRNTSAYEKNFMMALREAAAAGLTSQNLDAHIELYDKLFEAGYQYVARIALSKHRGWLSSWQIEAEEVASVIATKLLFESLDRFMNYENPIGYCNKATKSCVIDFVRKESRARNDWHDLKEKNQRTGQTDNEEKERTSTANVYLSDAGWGMVASNTNIEAEYILGEAYLSLLDLLKQNDSMHQVVSFLGTKRLGYKPVELTQMCLVLGEQELCRMVLRKSLPSNLKLDYYEDAAFLTNHLGWENYEHCELPQRISKASDQAQNKVRRSMRKTL